MSSGISRKNHRITITSGIERSVLTYAAAGITSHFLPDSRISASSVPIAMPPSIAMSVSCTEKISPLRMKLETTWAAQEREVEVRFIAPPIIPGTCTRFSMKRATRLTANAETKYSAVTAR